MTARLFGDWFVVAIAGAAAAEGAAVSEDFAFEGDAFATFGAYDALALVARKLVLGKIDLHPFMREQLVVRQFAIGEHLLLVFVVEFGVHLSREGLGRFERCNANGPAGLNVDEGCRHFAPIAKLERAFAETAIGDESDGIGGATIDLDECDDAFAVGTLRIIDAKQLETVHRESHAENLSGAEMTVRNRGFIEILIERLH